MKYICIHGHFYQPPRENAWLEYIQKQDSAAPFHNWNERINFECYAPNRAARLLDGSGKIIDIINNYEYISFNFGPTLLSWLEIHDPITYEFLQKADIKSAERLDGHGNAMAQVYNHMIMPLATKNDKETQIIWGIRDFEYRFGRKPEGMWLAETAVDSETLGLMVDQGITFVVLAPRQFHSYITSTGEEIAGEEVDTTKSYKVILRGGKEMTIFFYDGPLSQGIAFEKLLNDGRYFAQRLMGAGQASADFGLVNVATDGETYGHHHRYGEMALASCIHMISQTEDFQLVNYAWYAAHFKPDSEVKLVEESSWSCVHGVERWRSDCGCNTGGNHTWNQQWRGPLRDALDWLRDGVQPLYMESASKLIKDPVNARNAYIDIILNRTDSTRKAFFDKWAVPNGVEKGKETKILRLFELQRNLMLMYTSCGWFFDEVSGVETNQILQYAARAIAYTKTLFGKDMEKGFLEKLEHIPSNLSIYKNAANSYKDKVMPGIVTLERVAMHVAATSVFEEDLKHLELFNYEVTSKDFEKIQFEERILAFGITNVKSKVTLLEEKFAFVAGYFGQHFLHGNIKVDFDSGEFKKFAKEMKDSFEELNRETFQSKLEAGCGGHSFSLDQLFAEQKRKILNSIVQRNLKDIYKSMMQIHENNYELMNLALKETLSLNSAFVSATNFIMNQNIKMELEKGSDLSVHKLKVYCDELKKWHLKIEEKEVISYMVGETLFNQLRNCLINIGDEDLKECLEKILSLYEWSQNVELDINMWRIQNKIYRLLKSDTKGKDFHSDDPVIVKLLKSFGMEGIMN